MTLNQTEMKTIEHLIQVLDQLQIMSKEDLKC